MLGSLISGLQKRDGNIVGVEGMGSGANLDVPPIGNLTSLTSLNYNQMEDNLNRNNIKQMINDPSLGHGDFFGIRGCSHYPHRGLQQQP